MTHHSWDVFHDFFAKEDSSESFVRSFVRAFSRITECTVLSQTQLTGIWDLRSGIRDLGSEIWDLSLGERTVETNEGEPKRGSQVSFFSLKSRSSELIRWQTSRPYHSPSERTHSGRDTKR